MAFPWCLAGMFLPIPGGGGRAENPPTHPAGPTPRKPVPLPGGGGPAGPTHPPSHPPKKHKKFFFTLQNRPKFFSAGYPDPPNGLYPYRGGGSGPGPTHPGLLTHPPPPVRWRPGLKNAPGAFNARKAIQTSLPPKDWKLGALEPRSPCFCTKARGLGCLPTH